MSDAKTFVLQQRELIDRSGVLYVLDVYHQLGCAEIGNGKACCNCASRYGEVMEVGQVRNGRRSKDVVRGSDDEPTEARSILQ
jgi:hypothetical protein